MRIASFIGQKGGVGKSALARVLAVAAAKQGQKVIIADFDLEQLSCVEWSATRLREEVSPEIEARPFKSLKKLRKSLDDFDLVVVDTRGLADGLTAEVAEESDIIFLPTGTSSDDLRPTLALARKLARKGNEKRIVLVLSRVGRSERMLEEALSRIETEGFSMLDAHWPQRDGFQAEFDAGRAGSESRNAYLRVAAEAVETAMLDKVSAAKSRPQG